MLFLHNRNARSFPIPISCFSLLSFIPRSQISSVLSHQLSNAMMIAIRSFSPTFTTIRYKRSASIVIIVTNECSNLPKANAFHFIESLSSSLRGEAVELSGVRGTIRSLKIDKVPAQIPHCGLWCDGGREVFFNKRRSPTPPIWELNSSEKTSGKCLTVQNAALDICNSKF